jgi:hypothetical protein
VFQFAALYPTRCGSTAISLGSVCFEGGIWNMPDRSKYMLGRISIGLIGTPDEYANTATSLAYPAGP